MISPIVWVLLVLFIVVVGVLMFRKKECKYYKEDGKCVTTCKNKIWDFKSKSCVAACPVGTFERQIDIKEGTIDNEKIVQWEQWKICTECPEGKVYYNGSCIDEEKCLSDGKKLRFDRYGITCVDSCDPKNEEEKDTNYCFEKNPNPCSNQGLIHPITRECCANEKNFSNYYIEIKDKRGNFLKLPSCDL